MSLFHTVVVLVATELTLSLAVAGSAHIVGGDFYIFN